MNQGRRLPIVLCLSGHDPSGGAGIQADAEAVSALGCHACTVITALTEQDSCQVYRLDPEPAERVLRHARRILDDSPVAAIKIGLLGSVEIVWALAELLRENEGIPVVLDPVLASGGGTPLADSQLVTSMRQQLFPRTTLITPNSEEARKLAGTEQLADCAHRLRDLGCKWVLITGTHEADRRVVNRLSGPAGLVDEADWPRLPASYHGSGCTLAAGVAARVARGDDMVTAARAAQEFTWKSLSEAIHIGHCQTIPDRLFALQRWNEP